jgi:hypothetical protein
VTREVVVEGQRAVQDTPATVSPSACEHERATISANRNASLADAAEGAAELVGRLGGTYPLCVIPGRLERWIRRSMKRCC